MKSKGFTIIEVLIVLTIAGILVALVMTILPNLQEQADQPIDCEKYARTSVENLPAGCLEYYQVPR